ncbi:conserved Plasmodium protein, unknown function [Plasmodium yoelii]|uniref:CCAAT-box DNA binding protein subunit B n=2 Tax=Plasmodium yoelii TaxID=5861 RepID=A0AAE9WRQ4_PLAYO|nr:conserved Plasmodium protein, unknown function [Plasmodium yoelii]WBY58750.1 hypothetical protein Py17XNL_001105733 [Plasmodium yoelii yoelii]CDU19026.1 conserved Plasmodium protein, unknown function [Plasmodium yoelii]VTZ79611.1 conserved Plasmodium protein, unknown function [Plasmodium yoelii]|eukprot:XP_022812452.1 conserved Plasmodium protein, unknown function [Plasmodium yoelii]
MQNTETNEKKTSRNSWVKELQGTYSNFLISGSKSISYLSSTFNGDQNLISNIKTNVKNNKNITNDIDDNVLGDKNEENNISEKKKIIFEVYKKYYFIEMTKYHTSREKYTTNFLNFLEGLNYKMSEALKHGEYNINNLNIFFKEFLKNDTSYYKGTSLGSNRINNLSKNFMNISGNDSFCDQCHSTINVENDNINYCKQSNETNDSMKSHDGFTNIDKHQSNSKENNNSCDSKKKNYDSSKISIDTDKKINEQTEHVKTNEANGNIVSTTYERKNKPNEMLLFLDKVIDVDANNYNYYHTIINDWAQFGFINYTKIMNNMKASGNLIDNEICQKFLVTLKDSYIKEEDNLMAKLKKKKNEFLKQIDTCKMCWKHFENSYSNSKKIKCSWLCQRKYLKNVKILIQIQINYIEIICECIQIYFQLNEWKKNAIKDILCSYILLYKSFLNIYINNINILYDSILQEKHIEISQFNNLKTITDIDEYSNDNEQMIRQIHPFKFDKNKKNDDIPKFQNALNLINNNIFFFSKEYNIRSMLCLFCSNIKGHLTNAGIFNKYIEGIFVITWDKFIHFFSTPNDVSPQWSYHIDDIEIKLIRIDKNTENSNNDSKDKQRNPNDEENNEEKKTIPETTSDKTSIDQFKISNNEIDVQIREKRKLLRISGWSFTFRCNTSHLTNVCYELMNNHLDSSYYKEDLSFFSNFFNIISNGEIRNDLLFTKEMANLYNNNNNNNNSNNNDEILTDKACSGNSKENINNHNIFQNYTNEQTSFINPEPSINPENNNEVHLYNKNMQTSWDKRDDESDSDNQYNDSSSNDDNNTNLKNEKSTHGQLLDDFNKKKKMLIDNMKKTEQNRSENDNSNDHLNHEKKNVSSQIDEKKNVSSQIDEEKNVSSQIDDEKNVSSQVDDEKNVSSQIDDEKNVSSQVDEEKNEEKVIFDNKKRNSKKKGKSQKKS